MWETVYVVAAGMTGVDVDAAAGVDVVVDVVVVVEPDADDVVAVGIELTIAGIRMHRYCQIPLNPVVCSLVVVVEVLAVLAAAGLFH